MQSNYKNITLEHLSVNTYKVTIASDGKVKTFESNSNAAFRLFSAHCNTPKTKFSGYTERQAEKALLEEAIYAN